MSAGIACTSTWRFLSAHSKLADHDRSVWAVRACLQRYQAGRREISGMQQALHVHLQHSGHAKHLRRVYACTEASVPHSRTKCSAKVDATVSQVQT